MAGNSSRRGAVRKTPRKGPTVGSGGQRRKGLEGRGPTPKAQDRVHHKAHKASRPAKQQGPARRSGRSARGGAAEMIAGRNAVLEALQAGVPVTAVHVAMRVESDDRVRAVLRLAGEGGLPVLEVPRGELDRLTGGAVHQGLAAQIPPFEYRDAVDLLDRPGGPDGPAGTVPLIVALDGVTDPRNLGAVIRSVAAFGGHGVVVPERRSVGVTAGTWKSSAGTVARVPVSRTTNLTRFLQDAQRRGYFVVGLDADGEAALPGLELAGEPLVLVVGSEGGGLGRLVRQACDQVVSIPMVSAVESLNAGVAAGIALYEIARRRTELTWAEG